MKKILILTNKEDITVDFVIKELQTRKISYYRLNTEDIPEKVRINFDFDNNMFTLFDKVKEINYNLLDFDSVYYRRPQVGKLNYIEDVSVEECNYLRSELMFILEGIYKLLKDKYWLNNVYYIREAENKVHQLQLAKQIGFNIPKSIITNIYDNIANFVISNDSNCIIKPIKSGNMDSVVTPKVVFTTKVHSNLLKEKDRLECFPAYFQENISKTYDIRATVIGNKVFAAEIHSQNNKDSQIDWRRGKNVLIHQKHKLPKEIEKMCVQITKKLKLNYSAIDLIFTDNGKYIFLESNPNGQWAWIEKRLGYPLSKEIVDMLVNGGEQCVE